MRRPYFLACAIAMALACWLGYAADKQQQQTDYFQRVSETK